MQEKVKKGIFLWLLVGLAVVVPLVIFNQPFHLSTRHHVYFICAGDSERYENFLGKFKEVIFTKVEKRKIYLSRDYEVYIGELQKDIVKIFFLEPREALMSFNLPDTKDEVAIRFSADIASEEVLEKIEEFERFKEVDL